MHQQQDQRDLLSLIHSKMWGSCKKKWTVAWWSKVFRWQEIWHFTWKSRSQSQEEEGRITESFSLSPERNVHIQWWFETENTHCVFWSLFTIRMEILILLSSRAFWHLHIVSKAPKTPSKTIESLCLTVNWTQQTWTL